MRYMSDFSCHPGFHKSGAARRLWRVVSVWCVGSRGLHLVCCVGTWGRIMRASRESRMAACVGPRRHVSFTWVDGV